MEHVHVDERGGSIPPSGTPPSGTMLRYSAFEGRERGRVLLLWTRSRATSRVAAMLWGWIVRTMTRCPDRAGLFGYLAVRDGNRCQIKLECARQRAFKDLIDDLPRGATYREITGDSRREIWLPPPASKSPVFVLPVLHHESEPGPCVPAPVGRAGSLPVRITTAALRGYPAPLDRSRTPA